MLREELGRRSPLRVFEKSIHGGLGLGNLGVFLSYPGTGKTACLVHIAIDKLLQDKKIVHVAVKQSIENVQVWYDEVFTKLACVLAIDNTSDIRKTAFQNRIIFSFQNNGFSAERLTHDIDSIVTNSGFYPKLVIIDDLDFEKADILTLSSVKKMAKKFGMEIWFSACIAEGYTTEKNKDIPFPCSAFSDLFSVAVVLESEEKCVNLRLLKDHDSDKAGLTHVVLDPGTFLISDEI